MANTSRQPAGVPTGGQFAASHHAEAEISLTEPRRPGDPVTIPPGRYVIGDPCYSVPDDRWMEWLEAADYTEVGRGVLYAEIDGHHVVGVSTAHGDGGYESSEGHSLGVDAGLIGLVPEAFAENNTSSEFDVVEFTEPVTCRYDNGVIHLGHIEIDTDPSVTHNEDEDDDWDEEDDCANCSETIDGGGWDGYCGHCSDLVSMHEAGEHDEDPESECPKC